ncbi:DUF739 family protein [Staphylococcus pseudintermedius]|uniref:DUF739 family protein n=1 Tax=Staphylococcus pseudintermedius TaxID=283734 RepID=UPI002929BE37|nr:DUF739 family protein [Staphylococcus pseudintermedius]MDU9297358.1 DUF739 family protein [Staphylococcus pseudintermedius]MDU9298942.1 DUF739 family protein [Staphylococcus pseudintermedius]MDU9301619.1 DUF739 family protein [Staphylococcus pseudintermedius]
MCFNYSALNGKIIEVYKTRANFAKALDLSERSLSLKLNNKVGWKQKEIAKAIELLKIDESEIPLYFFDIEVQNY